MGRKKSLSSYLTHVGNAVGTPKDMELRLKERNLENYSSRLSDANNSLEALDKMYSHGKISEKQYHKLREEIYFNYKDYLPIAASVFFFLSGIILLTPNLTGFSFIEGISRPSSGIFGGVCFLLGISFLGVFVRGKRMIREKK